MNLLYYVDLLGYSNRIDAFRRAIRECVRPGDRVLDVGTGLGTFAFFATQSGASSVVAVDSNPVVHLAQAVAAANGLADAIEFVRGSLPGTPLEGDFDVVVFEDFPTSFLDQRTYALVKHLHDNHLSPGGRMIPRSARLSLALVHSRSDREIFPPGEAEPVRFGVDWSGVLPFLANAPRQVSLRPDEIRGEPAQGPCLPLCPVPRAPALRVEGRWDVAEPGVVDGLALWFDLEVFEGGWISNEPKSETEPWGQWLLPVAPLLVVAAGQTVEASVWRETLENGGPGWLGWECRVGDDVRRGHEFAGRIAGPEDLTGSAEGPTNGS